MNNTEVVEIISRYDVNFCKDNGETIQAERIVEAVDIAIGAIKRQKTSRWIKREKGFWTFVNNEGERDGWLPSYECDNCGSASWKAKYKYCPMCGARMENTEY